MIKRPNRAMCLLLAVIMLFSLPINVSAIKQGTPVPETTQSQAVRDAYSNIKALTGNTGLIGFEGDNQLPEDNSPVSVIVLFNNQPAATIKAAAEIENDVIMSMSAAQKVADADHAHFKSQLAQMFGGRSSFSANSAEYAITSEYHNALNGVTLTLPADRVEDLLELDSVYAVYPNAEVRLDADELASLSGTSAESTPEGGKGGRDQMNADALHDLGVKGADVDILIIDSGVDYNHPALAPAFKDVSPSGDPSDLKDGKFYGRNFVDNEYDKVYRADNDPLEATYEEWLGSGHAWVRDGYEFSTMHGTHVTGSAVARDVFNDGSGDGALGVAPEANVYVYRVFGAYSSALTEFILNAIEYVAIDQPDVVNMSLGAGINNPDYLYSLAVNNIMIQNPMIVFVIAAGNYGEQGVFSLGSPSTSSTAITVANATAKVVNTEYQLSGPRTTSQSGTLSSFYIRPLYMDLNSELELQSVSYKNPANDAVSNVNMYVSTYPQLKLHTEGDLQGRYRIATVLDAANGYDIGVGSAANFEFTAAYYENPEFFKNSIVFVRRGENFETTAQLAIQYGAGAVLLLNHSSNGQDGDPSGIESFRGRDENFLPFFVVEQDAWGAISGYFVPNGNYNLYNAFGLYFRNLREVTVNPSLDITSSRGPVGVTFDIKPDVSAHGTQVTSTVPLYDASLYNDKNDYTKAYGAASGTSMASPHVAGAAALLRGAYPDMTAEEIKIRLMNSAKPMDIVYGAVDAKYGVFEQGAGLVDVLAAYKAQAYFSVEYSNVSVPSLIGEMTDYNTIAKQSRDTGSFSFGKMLVSDDDEKPNATTTLTGKITNPTDAPQIYNVSWGFNSSGALVIQNSWPEIATLEGKYNNIVYGRHDTPIAITVPAHSTEEYTLTLTVNNSVAMQNDAYSGSIEGYVYITDESWTNTYFMPFAAYLVLDKDPIAHGFLNRPVISTSEENRQNPFSSNADFFFTMNKAAHINFAVLNPDLYNRDLVVDGMISYEDLTSTRMLMGSLETYYSMEYITEGEYYRIGDLLDGTYYPFAFDDSNPEDNFPIGVYYPDEGHTLPKLKEGLNALLLEAYTFEGEAYYYVYEFYVDNTPAEITLTDGDTSGDYGTVPGIVNGDTITLTGTVYDREADIMANLGLRYEIWEDGDMLGNVPDQSFTVLYAEVNGDMYKADVNPETGAFSVEIPKIALPANILLHAVDGFSIISYSDVYGNRTTEVADDFALDRPSCAAPLKEKYLSYNYGFIGSTLNTMLVTVGQTADAAFTLSDDRPVVYDAERLTLDVLFNGAATLAMDWLDSAEVGNSLYATATVSDNQIIITGLRNGETTLTVTTHNGLSRTFSLTVGIRYNQGVDLSQGVEVYYGATKHLVNYSFDPADSLNLPTPTGANYEAEASPIVWTIMGNEILADGTEGNLSLLSKYVIDARPFTINGAAFYAERDYTIRQYLNGGYWYTDYNGENDTYTEKYAERHESFTQYFTDTELSAIPPSVNEAYYVVNGEVYSGTLGYGDLFFIPWVAWDTEGYGANAKIYTSVYWNATSSTDERNALIYKKTENQLVNTDELSATLKDGITGMPYMTETALDGVQIQIIPQKGGDWPSFGGSALARTGLRPGTTLDVNRVIYAHKDSSGASQLTLVAQEPETIGIITGDLDAANRLVDLGENYTANIQVEGSDYNSIAYKILDDNGEIVGYDEISAEDAAKGTITFITNNLPAGDYKIVVWPQKSSELYSNEAGKPAALYVTVTEKPILTVTYSANGGIGETVVAATELYHVVLAGDTFTAPNGMEFVSWNTSANGLGTEYTPGEELELTDSIILYAIWRTVEITLESIITPDNIDGIAHGAEATAEALGLPNTVTLVTSGGNVQASVVWDVSDLDYNPENLDAQTFTVQGEVTLPDHVNNTNNVPLAVTISVTVLGGALNKPIFIEVIQPGAIIGLANGTEKTAQALGLPEKVMVLTTEGKMALSVIWDVENADYNPAERAHQTFTVDGVVEIPEGINSDEPTAAVTINVTVDGAADVLLGIIAPQPIGGLLNGTAKTAQALGLPETVEIETSFGYIWADVTWIVASSPYSTANKAQQTFTVTGVVTLPQGIVNTNALSLETSIEVTVLATKIHTITFDPGRGTVSPTTMKTNAATGTLNSLPVPTRSGYTFRGWYTAASGGTEVTENYVFTEPMVVYAQWKQNSVTPIDPELTPDSEITDPVTPTPTEPVTPEIGGGTITTPEGQPPVIDAEGNATLPGGGTVATENGAVIDAPAGTIIDKNGTIAIPDGKKAEMTLVGGQEMTLTGGSVITDDGMVTVGAGGATVSSGGITLNLGEGVEILLSSNSPLGYIVLSATDFADVPGGTWYTDSVSFVANHGLFKGVSESDFAPNTPMTRGMLATVLSRLGNADMDAYGDSRFSDVASGTWYAGPVEWAAQMGIVNGTGEGSFSPDASITREQLAVMLYNFANAYDIDLSADAKGDFADQGNISGWAQEAVNALQSAGIINGKDGNRFDPKGQATRAEVSAMLERFVMLAMG